jgi:hypothetical protein
VNAVRCALALTALSALGCTARYTVRPVEVVVTSPTTGEPVADAPVSVRYGFMMVTNPPEAAVGRTDANGRVVLPIADFDRGCISLEAAGNSFPLDALTVRSCGPLKRWAPESDKDKPEVAVRLVPWLGPVGGTVK